MLVGLDSPSLPKWGDPLIHPPSRSLQPSPAIFTKGDLLELLDMCSFWPNDGRAHLHPQWVGQWRVALRRDRSWPVRLLLVGNQDFPGKNFTRLRLRVEIHWNPMIHEVLLYIAGGVGFLPSTVSGGWTMQLKNVGQITSQNGYFRIKWPPSR